MILSAANIFKTIRLGCILLLMIGSLKINAQNNREIVSEEQVWTGYFSQIRLTNKWGIWTDLQLRTKEDFVNNLSLSIVRVGVTYYIADNIRLTAGYAWANYFPGDNHKNISQTEHRPWQQFQWDASGGSIVGSRKSNLWEHKHWPHAR